MDKSKLTKMEKITLKGKLNGIYTRMPRFSLYDIYLDKRLKNLNMDYVYDSIDRHRSGDYGILPVSDWYENEWVLEEGITNSVHGFIFSNYEYIDAVGNIVQWSIDTDFYEKITVVEVKRVINIGEERPPELEKDVSDRKDDGGNEFVFYIYARDINSYIVLDRDKRMRIPFDLSKIYIEEIQAGGFTKYPDGKMYEVTGRFYPVEEIFLESSDKVELVIDEDFDEEEEIAVYDRKVRERMQEILGKGKLSTFDYIDEVKSILNKVKQHKKELREE